MFDLIQYSQVTAQYKDLLLLAKEELVAKMLQETTPNENLFNQIKNIQQVIIQIESLDLEELKTKKTSPEKEPKQVLTAMDQDLQTRKAKSIPTIEIPAEGDRWYIDIPGNPDFALMRQALKKLAHKEDGIQWEAITGSISIKIYFDGSGFFYVHQK